MIEKEKNRALPSVDPWCIMNPMHRWVPCLQKWLQCSGRGVERGSSTNRMCSSCIHGAVEYLGLLCLERTQLGKNMTKIYKIMSRKKKKVDGDRLVITSTNTGSIDHKWNLMRANLKQAVEGISCLNTSLRCGSACLLCKA